MQARNLIDSPNNWSVTDRSATFIVYCITHEASGDSYTGSTSRPLRQRIKEHRKDVKQGSSSPLHNAIREFGWNAFRIEITKQSNAECLRSDEITEINAGTSVFNQAKGSTTPSSGWHHSVLAVDMCRSSKIGAKNPAAKSIVVFGVLYSTVKDACAALGVSFPTLRARLMNPAMVDYKYKEEM